MLSVAQYGSVEASSGSTTRGGGVAQPTLHEWLAFGVRGQLDL